MSRDNSLREASSDSERLAMCKLAGIISEGLHQKAPDLLMTNLAIMDLKVDFNIVSLNLAEYGEFEIIVRKKF